MIPDPGAVFVVGIVAARNLEPYVQMDVNGRVVQLSVTDARQIAADLVLAASRAEADAMILRFFKHSDFPAPAGEALMLEFRNFRARLDSDKAERPEGKDQT